MQIMPPTLGEQVSAGRPNALSATTADLQPAEAEDHPLLRVESIPVGLNDPARQRQSINRHRAERLRVAAQAPLSVNGRVFVKLTSHGRDRLEQRR